MSGNVWEWCRNKYDKPEDEKIDQSNARRVLRGGSWLLNRGSTRAASRSDFSPDVRLNSFGFRVVLVRRPPSQGH
jgi:formylglycine-generating enzyme required for sulfatase activity